MNSKWLSTSRTQENGEKLSRLFQISVQIIVEVINIDKKHYMKSFALGLQHEKCVKMISRVFTPELERHKQICAFILQELTVDPNLCKKTSLVVKPRSYNMVLKQNGINTLENPVITNNF